MCFAALCRHVIRSCDVLRTNVLKDVLQVIILHFLCRKKESQHSGQPQQHKRDHHRCDLLHRPYPSHRLRHRPNQAAAQKVHPPARGL